LLSSRSLIGFADDICQNDEPSRAVAAYSGPKGLLEAQKKGASVFDGVSKSLIYSPDGALGLAHMHARRGVHVRCACQCAVRQL